MLKSDSSSPVSSASEPPEGLRVVDVKDISLDHASKQFFEDISEQLDDHGAILVRGVANLTPERFQSFTDIISNNRVALYKEKQSPRVQLSPRVFTSTEHPSTEWIRLHNENAHRISFPGRIMFGCSIAADTGGATTFASNREIERAIPSETLDRFFRKGIRYRRTFGYGFGYSWQEVFATDEIAAAEQYMKNNGMGWDWESADRLRVWYDRPAFVQHPLNGERVWCNNIVHYHPRSLEPRSYRAYRLVLSEEDMPYSVCFADGEPIDKDTLETISDASDSATRRFDWKPGDLLLLDNIRFSHGREPFTGERKVLVAMSYPVRRLNSWQADGVAITQFSEDS